MGVTLSYPGGGHESLDDGLHALMRSLSLGNSYIKSTLRSVSFNGRDSEPVLKAGKLIVKGSLSFNSRIMDKEPRFYRKSPISPKETQESPEKSPVNYKNSRFAPPSDKIDEPGSPKHAAAVKLQKVYKSFRTRRQLADCAVLVEQRWWKLLDFAMLRRSSVSFFNIERNESAVSKWARAKSRAAKVGKGLSKDVKARKLALQHWLEAIDPRHRYGHNLHFYYDCWLRCESKQPFFYWLDIGEGKEVSIDDKCSRTKLQQQCIKYLGPKEREEYEVEVEDGKLMYKKNREVLDTTDDSTDSKWIFVLSTTKNLYVGQKKKGIFQHSSFMAGGATSAAGRLEVKKGILKAIWPHSGHYRPTEENFEEFVTYLKAKDIDLTNVKKSPEEGEEDAYTSLRPSRSEVDLSRRISEESEEQEPNGGSVARIKNMKRSKSYSSQLRSAEEERATKKQMIMTDDSEESEEEHEEEGVAKTNNGDHEDDTNHGESETLDASSASNWDYMFRRPSLFIGEQEEGRARVPSELILRRMNFRTGDLSLQLGKKLGSRWTTGAGPRIGCVLDSPSELRFRALEQVNLSPRGGAANSRSWPLPPNAPSSTVSRERCAVCSLQCNNAHEEVQSSE